MVMGGVASFFWLSRTILATKRRGSGRWLLSASDRQEDDHQRQAGGSAHEQKIVLPDLFFHSKDPRIVVRPCPRQNRTFWIFEPNSKTTTPLYLFCLNYFFEPRAGF